MLSVFKYFKQKPNLFIQIYIMRLILVIFIKDWCFGKNNLNLCEVNSAEVYMIALKKIF